MSIDTQDDKANYADWKAPQPPTDEIKKRQRRWQALRAEIDKLTDGLDKGIDEGIKESVVAFQALEIPTNQSCSGHLGEDEEGYAAPWVEVYAPEPDGWQADERKQEQWKQENLKQRKRLEPLLEEFYSNRPTPPDKQLTISDVGIFGGFRVQSTGLENLATISQNDQINKIKSYQQEMRDFTEFVKQKFLESTP